MNIEKHLTLSFRKFKHKLYTFIIRKINTYCRMPLVMPVPGVANGKRSETE